MMAYLSINHFNKLNEVYFFLLFVIVNLLVFLCFCLLEYVCYLSTYVI